MTNLFTFSFCVEAIKTRSNQALVKFVSDHSGEHTGFKLLWKAYMKEFDNIVPVFQPDERGNSFGEIFQLSKFQEIIELQ